MIVNQRSILKKFCEEVENVSVNTYKEIWTARSKLMVVVDQGSFCEMDKNLISGNPLKFIDYKEELEKAQKESGEKEAVISGYAKIGGIPCVVFILEPKYMMGSMGSVVGEKITRAFEVASRKRIPVISFSASGGVRMQEGVLSLMQMAKTAGAVYRHRRKKLLYISVICDPTLGGVTASYASLADIIIAEENARYGFTGKRIIKKTIGVSLPADFQQARYAQKKGQIDMVIKQENMRDMLITLLELHKQK